MLQLAAGGRADRKIFITPRGTYKRAGNYYIAPEAGAESEARNENNKHFKP